jgi:hypothetical protein
MIEHAIIQYGYLLEGFDAALAEALTWLASQPPTRTP